MEKRIILCCLLVGLTAGPGSGCSPENYFHYVENRAADNKINDLIAMIEEENDQMRFVLINEISELLLKYGDKYKQVLFFTDYVEKHPLDPYNGLYLYSVAGIYEELRALPFSIHYYERILNNYPDINSGGSSIHYACIQKLLKYVNAKEKIIEYYKLLLSRFFEKSKNDIGRIYYNLARTYEGLGEWERAIQEYMKFLKYPDTRISDDPGAHRKVREKVRFYYSNKKWTRKDLKTLVAEITIALRRKNVRALKNLESDLSFFTMYWNQKEFSEERAESFSMNSFLLSSDVRISSTLHEDSNASEAFLKTTKWSYRIPTWYLYFKRINFPTDPDYYGSWEWAGIYFGEKDSR